MKEGGGYAFPSEHPYPEGGHGATRWHTGMTMRQWYKGQAPAEIPEWFQHQQQPKPDAPPMELRVSVDSNRAGERPELQRLVDDWRGDPCYDLGDLDATRAFEGEDWTEEEQAALCEYEKVWEAHWSDVRAWNRFETESRYFQWCGYYADALIAEDEKAKEGGGDGQNAEESPA